MKLEAENKFHRRKPTYIYYLCCPKDNDKSKPTSGQRTGTEQREAPRTENQKLFWTQNSNEMSTIFPARKSWRISTGKATERASAAVENVPALQDALYNCTTGAHVTRCNGQPLQILNGAGKPARAGGRCNVIMPSRPVRVRARLGRGAGRYLRPRRRQLVSESVPHTCRTAGPRRPD